MRKLIQISALSDNYIYLCVNFVENQIEHKAFIVDPSESRPVLEYLKQNPSIKLEAILNTHHHFDHVGGNEEIRAQTGCEIYGIEAELPRIKSITKPVQIGQELEIAGFDLKIHDVHAHTKHHIAFETGQAFDQVFYYDEIKSFTNKRAIFVGDSLFLGGCGRLFEGTPEDLVRVMRFYKTLDPELLVCCGHEYTQHNLEFGLSVQPENSKIKSRLENLSSNINSKSTVPDLLGKEFETNVFMLCLENQADSIKSMGDLRLAKDNF